MKKPLKVEYNMVSGFPSDVIPHLERSLSQYNSRYSCVKVGITGRAPEERFAEHRRGGWKRMVVKYVSSSRAFVNRMEDYFIYTRPWLNNRWHGLSHIKEEGDNYLYFIMK